MFFSAEILLKRESGLGLLWLAATIGPKASYSKLEKRSLLSANIQKLCDMIAEPDEPLALRLSSNLLIGIARVHRAQIEHFSNDVMTCWARLKRATAELATDNQLQGPLTLSKDQITLKNTVFDIEFDLLDAYWIDAAPRVSTPLLSQDDVEMDVVAHERGPRRPPLSSDVSADRKKLHLLEDNLNSFELSGPSDGPYDPFLEPLGPGEELDLGPDFLQEGFDLGGGVPAHELTMDDPEPEGHEAGYVRGSSMSTGVSRPARHPSQVSEDALRVGAEGLEIGDNNLNDFGSNAADSQFPNQAFDDFGEGARDDEIPIPPQKPNSPKKKRAAATGGAKRKHGLWDENIDLADEQLKGMRDGYEERMVREKKEAQNKTRRFEATDLVQSMMNAPLLGVVDEGMATWWSGLIKSRYNDHSAAGRIEVEDGFAIPSLPPKRRKTTKSTAPGDNFAFDEPIKNDAGGLEDFQMGGMDDVNMQPGDVDMFADAGHVRPPSVISVEAEEGRKGSTRPNSAIGSHIEGRAGGSQRSSIFPWSNAGRDRNSNRLGSESSNVGVGGPGGGFGTSSSLPGDAPRGFELDETEHDPFIFEDGEAPALETADAPAAGDDSQRTDMSLITLERTMETQSFEFLRDLNTKVDGVTRAIDFDVLLEPARYTRRVAATGFYHLLVLSTKNLVHVEQTQAYGPVTLKVV